MPSSWTSAPKTLFGGESPNKGDGRIKLQNDRQERLYLSFRGICLPCRNCPRSKFSEQYENLAIKGLAFEFSAFKGPLAPHVAVSLLASCCAWLCKALGPGVTACFVQYRNAQNMPLPLYVR